MMIIATRQACATFFPLRSIQRLRNNAVMPLNTFHIVKLNTDEGTCISFICPYKRNKRKKKKKTKGKETKENNVLRWCRTHLLWSYLH